MKKVGIYIRVSTTEQAQEGYSIQAQQDKLLSYCKAKDWLVKDIFIDGGYSGSNIDRPALNRLLNALNNIDIVLVYKLDRLSRSQKDTLYLIEDKFIANNVDFVSITENFDTTTPFGRAMIGILSVFAQLERENIKERSKMGRIERAKKGLWAGPPNPPIGYDLIDCALIVNEYESIQVKEIFDLYTQGYGMQKIQNVFRKKGYTTKYGNWDNISTHTITRIIQNKVYIGQISYAKKWYKGIHVPIIDVDIFDKANELHKKRKGQPRSTKYFLSGLLYCESCGAKYITDKKDDRSIYICKNRKYGYKQDFKCMNKIFSTEELEQIATDKIKKMVQNKDMIINEYNKKNIKKDNNNDKVVMSRIKDIDSQINKLMDLYQLGTIPIEEISRRIGELYDEKKMLSKSIIESEKDNDEVNIEDVFDLLEDFNPVWEELSIEQKKEIASQLLGEKIKVSYTGI